MPNAYFLAVVHPVWALLSILFGLSVVSVACSVRFASWVDYRNVGDDSVFHINEITPDQR